MDENSAKSQSLAGDSKEGTAIIMQPLSSDTRQAAPEPDSDLVRYLKGRLDSFIDDIISELLTCLFFALFRGGCLTHRPGSRRACR